MARMIPKTPPTFHGSQGEERIFRALRALPDEVVVVHSLRWLHPGNIRALAGQLGAQGEGDFVLFDPAQGIMVVEVKGGDVWCEDGEWRQRNRKTNHVGTIWPEVQASDTAHRIRLEVTEKIPDAGKLLFCHAVWFPDGTVDRSQLPMNCHPDVTFDGEDVARPHLALQRAFRYWHTMFPGRRGAEPELVKRVLAVLAPTLSVVPSVRQRVDEREELFVQLTREQSRVLDFLDEQLHAAVLGAAGTGKTLLAVEKARRLASPTQPVLFLCYNSALRDHLERHHAQPNVRYHTFHGLVRELMGPGGTLDDATAALIARLTDDGPVPYDHLVIDEGQDFQRDWLECLRYRFRDKAFYVFYDRYQAVQGEKDTSWLAEVPCRLILTKNCRNTDPIAKVAYRAGGLKLTPNLGVTGPPPAIHTVADHAGSVALTTALVEKACALHHTPPHDIAVLSLKTIDEGSPWRVERLGGQRTSEKPQASHVTVTTARRFKGLEAALVVVVDVDFAQATNEEWRRLLYVACSRARHAVHIVTTTPESALGDAMRVLAGSDKVRASWRALSRHLSARLGGPNDDPFHEPGT